MILHDPYALNRKWWDSEWVGTFEDTLWTQWDFVLAEVYQTIQDYTDSETGQWIPFDQSGAVWWETRSSFSGSKAAIEKARDGRELKDGETLYAVPVFDESKPKPTLASWARDLEEGKADLRPERHRDARPPTAAELSEIRARKQAD